MIIIYNNNDDTIDIFYELAVTAMNILYTICYVTRNLQGVITSASC